MHGAFPKGGFTTTPSYDSRAVLKTHFLCLDFALDSPRQALYLESVIQTRVFSLEEGGCGRFLSSPTQGQEESFYKRLLEEGPARPSTGLLQVTPVDGPEARAFRIHLTCLLATPWGLQRCQKHIGLRDRIFSEVPQLFPCSDDEHQ